MKQYKIFKDIIMLIIIATISGCGAAVETTPSTTKLTFSDTTHPTVSSTSPANGTTDVAVNTSITATFNEAMKASTITTATFTLDNGTTGTVTYSDTNATFIPSVNLQYSTTYTATISTEVQDAAGNALTSSYTWTFTTGVNSDTILPTVSSTSPSADAIDVAVNATIVATFSETMKPSTITATTFTLDNGVTGTVTYSGTTATFTPSANLAYSTIYTATILTEVEDAAGNAMASKIGSFYKWKFKTGSEPDTILPTISSTSPANGATGVSVNSAIIATFSETMSAATITTTTFTLDNGVTGAVTYSGTTATFTPLSNLQYSTKYTATITTGAKDSAGNAIASNYTWTFTTGVAPDTTRPSISSTSPANGATGVSVNSAIIATFSENMEASTITTATFSLGTGINGAVTYSGTTATFTPLSILQYSTTYTATISTAAKDAAGNALASNYSWTFTTGVAPDTTRPSISSTNPANAATGVSVNSAITATFSEPMAASTITTATFTLGGGVTGAVTYSGTTATFTPSVILAYSTTYTATVTTGAKDIAGNAIVSSYTWMFTTGVAPDTTRPVVSSTSPANGVTGVPVNSAITATFSEAMAASTITTATFTLNNGVTGSVTYSGTTATFTPLANLATSTTYTAMISTGVSDVAGNAIVSNYTWTFTTVSTSAKLAWNAPTTNSDGSSITDLAGYKIYYGTSSGNYTSSVDVGNNTTYTFSNLLSETYYFSVKAYDTAGNESDYSNEVSKVL